MIDKSILRQMGDIRRIHFVGIGGVGMCGIAQVLANEGYQISGSDKHWNTNCDVLTQQGITVYQGHDPAHVQDVDVVVKSTAIGIDNTEVTAALEHNIPIVPRAEMLAHLMRYRFGIAIAGTHGKTTTTSLTASLLAEGGMDPTFVIGGKLNSIGATAKLGRSDYFVAEADESDASFLYLQPMLIVVTNIDEDHMETYNYDYQQLENTFLEFIHRIPFYGLAILCMDDPNVQKLLPKIKRPILTYGFSDLADVRAKNMCAQGTRTTFQVCFKSETPFTVTLNMPGNHNVLNALAGIAVAKQCQVDNAATISALLQFQGIGRRMQPIGTFQSNTTQIPVVDDYGHHPKELAATVQAARAAWPDKALTMIFQPHRYSRTKALFDDFCEVLQSVDKLVLLDIYSAGEAPIPKISSAELAEVIRQQGHPQVHYVEKLEHLAAKLKTLVGENDMIITQGAGSVGLIAQQLCQRQLHD